MALAAAVDERRQLADDAMEASGDVCTGDVRVWHFGLIGRMIRDRVSLPAMTFLPGDRLDRYELVCPIAQGGMAVVWAARLIGKHGFEKVVAIKMIRPEYASDLAFQRMFLDEARIAAVIEHPNIVHISELGEANGALYLVMEYVDGDALSKLLRVCSESDRTFPVNIACRIVADCLAGLEVAHELRDENGDPLGVVHRDVSPQNVLVSVAGVSKVIDFGIAKSKDRLAGETTTGTVKGKFSYMSPEQASGKQVDLRADVWAAGAVLYHLLAGKAPFAGDNPLATLHALMSATPGVPLPPSVPTPIASVVMRALHRDIGQRYATADQMLRDLERAMEQSLGQASVRDVAAFVSALSRESIDERKAILDHALRSLSDRHRGAARPREEGDRARASAPLASTAEQTSVDVTVTLQTELGAGATSTRMKVAPSHGRRAMRWGSVIGVAVVVVGLALGFRLRRRPGTDVAGATSPGVVGSETVLPIATLPLDAAAPAAPAASVSAAFVDASSAPRASSVTAVRPPRPAVTVSKPAASARAAPRNGELGF